MDKMKSLYGGIPLNWKMPEAEVIKGLLPEDFITAFKATEKGYGSDFDERGASCSIRIKFFLFRKNMNLNPGETVSYG